MACPNLCTMSLFGVLVGGVGRGGNCRMFISNVELIGGLNHSTSISFVPGTVLGSRLSATGETDKSLPQGANLTGQ